MSDKFRTSDERVIHECVAGMMATWPAFIDAEAERLADAMVHIAPATTAQKWLMQCREMLPANRRITSDWRLMRILERHAKSLLRVGINGFLYIFDDDSHLLANGDEELAYTK